MKRRTRDSPDAPCGRRRRQQKQPALRQPQQPQPPPPPSPPRPSARTPPHQRGEDEEQRQQVRRQEQQHLRRQQQLWRTENGRLRNRARITPWTCWEELDDVGRGLLLQVLVVPPNDEEDPTDDDAAASGPDGAPDESAAVTAPSQSPTDGGNVRFDNPAPPADPATTTKATDATSSVVAPNRQSNSNERAGEVIEDGERMVQWALDQVEIWKVRAGGPGSLPHAVEATHALASCLHVDRRSSGLGNVSSTSLGLVYASAITRTVNGLTDVLQQSRAVASSVAHLAQLLGLPGWVVDVRHQSTHNALPSLPVLRSAAHTLILYLDQVYWSPLRNRRQHYVDTARQLLVREVQHQPQPNRRTQSIGGPFDDAAADDEDPRMSDAEAAGRADDEYVMEDSDADLPEEESGGGDDDDEDEETYVASRSLSVPHKVLGTTFNRFAALLDDANSSSKDKKAKKKSASTAGPPSAKEEGPAAAAAERPADVSPPATTTSRPNALTWNRVPLDVAYRAVADHVTLYCRQQASPPPPPTVSAPFPPERFVLLEMAKRNPGLVPYVARELELLDDARTLSSEAAPDADTEPGVSSPFPGRAWAEALRQWIAREQEGTAALSTNKPRQQATTATTAAATSSHLHDRAVSILRRHGAGTKSWSGATHLPSVDMAESTRHVMGLEDMEALLNQSCTDKSIEAAQSGSAAWNGTVEDDNAAPTGAAPVDSWSLCEEWEPCAIGSLGRTARSAP